MAICDVCGGDIVPGNGHKRKYCSAECAKTATHMRWKQQYSEFEPFPKSLSGGANELLAGIELMRMGYYVFRALADHGPCDLVAMRGEALVRVEVTAGYKNRASGKYAVPKKPEHYTFDVLAIVFRDGTIAWEPAGIIG